MNIGSVPIAMTAPAPVAVSGNSVQTTGKFNGKFGSVLAGMTKSVETTKNPGSADQAGALSGTISEILSAPTVEDLAKVLESLTDIPQQDILSGLGKLGEASSIEEWAEVLALDPAELLETISTLLDEAGLTKEELAEVMYSNDLWTLLSVVNEQTPHLLGALGEMLNSEAQATPQRAADVLAFLKMVETVLPKKDLLGWQQTSLTELKGILDSETILKTSDFKSKDSIPSAFMSAIVNVTKSSQEQTPNDGKSEQNPSQLLHNTSVQPIVSRNVFSFETQETRPTSQSEALLAKLQGLFKQTNFGQQGGTNRLLVKLNPEQLGQIRIELIQTNGVMTARILASTALGKEMLDSQLHQLRQSFNQQNIQVDRIDVTQAVQDPSRNDRSQNFNHQQFKGNDDQQETEEHEHDEQQSFQEYLLDVEV
ncbi:flagellar hook-length control protein FliK [Sporosarcina gallistercoris]|uniref:Flagellar hook-length control protein FliK n=1 Tax=Sporosarcina gallistercoris TaxID=2762245 RepID=A0ABR8PG59_9BACL|nr:flagellar hook-length control protein FliK [Sporosarcina gallistercoris]MBD7907128.1 flagellar hook-length control protein FliK [Sporosarcina gallistercoris]